MARKEYTDYKRSKQGELLPNSNAEYLSLIKQKIIEAIEGGDYEGINPDARDLGDDFSTWAWMGEQRPQPEEVLDFGYKVLNSAHTYPASNLISRESFEAKVISTIEAIKQDLREEHISKIWALLLGKIRSLDDTQFQQLVEGCA